MSPYRALCFDTPDFQLYQLHQGGRRVRYKVRSCQYVGTPLAFFEVKHEGRPNHTRKQRLVVATLIVRFIYAQERHGGASSGTVTNGLYAGGAYTPGAEVTNFTVERIVTQIGGRSR